MPTTHKNQTEQNSALWDYYQNSGIESFSRNEPRLRYMFSKAKNLAGKNGKILNIGAGNGWLEKTALHSGLSLSSLDLSQQTIDRLRSEGVDAYQGTIEAMPFDTASFEIIIASEVLEHLTPEQCTNGLKEVKRVLKPGGHFIGTVPYNEILDENIIACPNCNNLFHRWGHAVSFQHNSLKNILSATFKNTTVHRKTFVQLKGRSLSGKGKGIARILLGKMGSALAKSNYYFECKIP
jgi:2-polyprenyl-3-methyl-5-hydroxy-6-metoxy-1,4-benzoquinol methylase